MQFEKSNKMKNSAIEKEGYTKGKKGFLLTILFFVAFSEIVLAQHYERTGQNIGVFGNFYIPEFSQAKGTARGTTQGTGFGFGISRQSYNIFFSELFFAQHQSKIYIPNDNKEWIQKNLTTNSVGFGILVKLDIFQIFLGKKHGLCHGRVFNLILGPEYVYPVGMNQAVSGLKQNGEFSAKAGIGMYSIWGGSSKKNAGKTIHWELYYHRSFTPYLKSDFGSMGSDKYYFSSVGITLRIVLYKTYKFSEM